MDQVTSPTRPRTSRFGASFVVALLTAGCGETPTTPVVDSLVVTRVTPASGSTIVLPPGYPDAPIVVLAPQSGLIGVSVDIQAARDVPWSQLYVYLLTAGLGSGYCGQNLPDAPTWGSLPAGWTSSYTVTGFQLVLPCDVTGIRAILHTRNNGLLIPPTPAETIAEATIPVSFRIQR